jgi:restriction system protein
VTTQPLTFRAAAERVLTDALEPLITSVITERALAASLIATDGKTPAATMEAQLATSIQQHGESSPFIRVAPRTYALRRWIAEGRIAAPSEESTGDVRIPHLPTYDELRAVLPVLAGPSRDQVTGMRAAIWEHTGTFDDNVSCTEPEKWIPERLTGAHRETALRIWRDTKGRVNPRHLVGPWLLANSYGLLAEDSARLLQLTARGIDVVDHPAGATIREIDEREAILWLLSLLAERGPAATGALVAPWLDHIKQISRIRAESTARSFLYHRLRNLLAREYVARVGQSYQITDAGLAWLKSSGFAERETAAPDETRQLWDLVQAQKSAVRERLREHLSEMHPYAFEQLVGRLLESMGYTEVEITSPSNDKGVDVVGRIVLGITEVKEVIQVKRHQRNVQRPVLDGLRGSLHRFQAVKGTIITLGGFASGARQAAFEAGAAPITLIDGEKLLDLLIDNGLGVRTKKIELLGFDLAGLEMGAEAE